MKKLRVMTIVGTRPDVIKLSEIIKKCDLYFDHILVHTGQNFDYTLYKIFFKELGIREPDYYLNVSEGNLGQVIGAVISKSYDLMRETHPDAVLVLGDTNSSLAVISAKRLKIPIFHLEAGNRCFDENLPEEINRRIVDHISDVNLCYTEHARRYLYAEGIKKEYTFTIGSPMTEVLSCHYGQINSNKVLQNLHLQKDNYILLSAHREENIDIEKNFLELMTSINTMADHYKMPVIYSVHPRSRKMIEQRNFGFHQNVRCLEPFGFLDYVCLEKNAFCVVSDSGTLAEECSILGFPAVSIRTSTERPEAFDKGNMVLGGITSTQVLQAVDLATAIYKGEEKSGSVLDYTDKNVSMKAVKIIQSYTDIVNLKIWRKQ